VEDRLRLEIKSIFFLQNEKNGCEISFEMIAEKRNLSLK